jgi:hypothetical protein
MTNTRTILLVVMTAIATFAAGDAPPRNAAGEVVVTFAEVTVGKPVERWTAGDVTFSLASAPQRSKARGRVMFFPHLKTGRKGILNAMANEQGVPVKAEIKGGASAVTLVLWGTVGATAWLEARDKDGKLLDRAALPGAVPQRKDPADAIPSFELSIRAENVAYVLFAGAPNGGALVADAIRYVPAK